MNPAGFVDLQVNGCYGVDFNSNDLHASQLRFACQRLQADGVAGILATIITDDIDAMCHRLANLRRICHEDESVAAVIWGIHIEGPFLNPRSGFIGAHPVHAAIPASISPMKRLLNAAGNLTKIVTLAPETDANCEVIRMLASEGIRISAGHTDATIEELNNAVDAGLSIFTHLGNGCPLKLHRHDNIIQRVLSVADRLYVGFIADGVHIPVPALKNYIRIVGFDRSFVVTDAIQAAGLGAGTYRLGNRSVRVDEHQATWSEDNEHLVGSASTMTDLVKILRTDAQLCDQEIEKLTSLNPRRLIA